MATPRAAWGIDLGNRALKAVKLVQSAAGPRIDDVELIEHEQILSNAGDNKESMLQTALASFVQRHDPRKIPLAISVSGKESFARFIKLPPVEPKRIPEIVRFEAIQQIPFPLGDVEWSYQLFQGPDSPDVEVGIFAMRKELVEKQINYFNLPGLNVQTVQMAPLAVYNAMKFDERISGTTMFMDAGAENTDLIIADADTVWLRTLPIGGNSFTEVLAKAFKLNFAKAEELKRNAATSKFARQIFQAMRPVFADMVAEVQRSIGFYASVHRDARIKRICALGGTFRLPALQKYLQQNLQLEVQRIDSFKGGTPTEGRAAAAFTEEAVSMAAAYGLALQAIGAGQITSSLLPERIRAAKAWKRKAPIFAAATALVVLGAIAAPGRYFVDNMEYTKQQNVRNTIETQVKSDEDFSRQWGEVENGGSDDKKTVLQVRQMTEGRKLWPEIYKKILGTMPPNEAYLTHVSVPGNSYYSDLSQYLDTNKTSDPNFLALGASLDAAAGLGTAAAGTSGTSDGSKRGFIITIEGWTPKPITPNTEAETFLIKSVVGPLAEFNEAKAAESQAPFYIGRVRLKNVEPRNLVIPRPANVSPEVDKADKLREDAARKQTKFVIVMAVVMNPKGADKGQGGKP